MAEAYNIDDSVHSFFETSTSVSRKQCDDLVVSRFNTPAQPVLIQGAWSYTVTAGENNSRVIQFRDEGSPIDPAKMDLVKQAASGFVPEIVYHGILGEDRPLHIYEMDTLPGKAYVIATDHAIPQPDDAKNDNAIPFKTFRGTVDARLVKGLSFRLTTSSFFAQSWNCAHPQASTPATLASEYGFKLIRLAESLPQRFAEKLLALEPHLPAVFSKLPYVVTHGDLCELNTLINPITGNITGIVDWAEVRVLPFGFALWALENILGYMDADGWHYYDNEDELRALFWATFLQQSNNCTDQDIKLIQVVRLIGLFCRYGFEMEGEKILGVVDETATSKMAYLDAFCLTETTLS